MTAKVFLPELKRMMDKRLAVKLNAGRRVIGTLRGFDQFMNIVLEDATDETPLPPRSAEQTTPRPPLGLVVLRGNSIVSLEPLEKL